jgi:hypothetical protein
MSWQRAPVAKALVIAMTVAAEAAADPVAVFDRQPTTLNPPALVVGRPVEVRFSAFAYGIDEADLPVHAVGPADGDDRVSDLIGLCRQAVADDPTLGGTVTSCVASFERNWRWQTLGGVDLTVADVVLTVTM